MYHTLQGTADIDISKFIIRIQLIFFFSLLVIGVQPLAGQMGREARYQPGDWVSYANFHYVTSFEEGDRYFYVGTTNGVLRYNIFSQQWEYPITVSNGLTNGYVLNVVWVDESQELWIINRGGIDVISGGLNRWFHIQGSQNIINPSLQQVRVGQTTESVLILTPDGQSHEYDKFSYSRVGSVNPSLGAGVWKILQPTRDAITNYLLDRTWHVNQANNTLVDNDFREYPITVQFNSSQGEIYLGTWGGGFIMANATTNVGRVIRFGPISTPVGAVADISGNLWFGSAFDQPPGNQAIYGQPGISFWDRSNGEWTHFSRESEPVVRSAQINSIDGDEKRVWVGTNRGLLSYDAADNSWALLRENQLNTSIIFDILVLDTTAWVGTDIGLFEVSQTDGQVRDEISILEGERVSVYSLTGDNDQIFAGTEFGLIRIDSKNQEIQYYDKDVQPVSPEQFRFSRVYQVTFSDGKLFYADNIGLYQYDVTADSMNQLPELGLVAQSPIRVLKYRNQKLWVGLDSGAGEYDVADNVWEFYTTEDGLSANRIYDIYVDPEFTWFATQNGVTRFRINWSGSN